MTFFSTDQPPDLTDAKIRYMPYKNGTEIVVVKDGLDAGIISAVVLDKYGRGVDFCEESIQLVRELCYRASKYDDLKTGDSHEP